MQLSASSCCLVAIALFICNIAQATDQIIRLKTGNVTVDKFKFPIEKIDGVLGGFRPDNVRESGKWNNSPGNISLHFDHENTTQWIISLSEDIDLSMTFSSLSKIYSASQKNSHRHPKPSLSSILCHPYSCKFIPPSHLKIHCTVEHLEKINTLYGNHLSGVTYYDHRLKLHPRIATELNSKKGQTLMSNTDRLFRVFLSYSTSYNSTNSSIGFLPIWQEKIDEMLHNTSLGLTLSHSPGMNTVNIQFRNETGNAPSLDQHKYLVNLFKDTFTCKNNEHTENSKIKNVFQYLASQASVEWIEEQVTLKPLNYFATQFTKNISSRCFLPDPSAKKVTNSLFPTSFAFPLTGKGQRLGIADTGLEMNHCFFTKDPEEQNNSLSADVNVAPQSSAQQLQLRLDDSGATTPVVDVVLREFSNGTPIQGSLLPISNTNKIAAYYYHPETDTVDYLRGHGTHVVGTLAGKLSSVDGALQNYRGMAPDAQIVFYDIQNSSNPKNQLVLPLDIVSDFFQPLILADAYVHSFSWGTELTKSEASNGYSASFAHLTDALLYAYPNLMQVYAAGNDGKEACCDRSIVDPAVGKNILAVGSSTAAQTDVLAIIDQVNATENNGQSESAIYWYLLDTDFGVRISDTINITSVMFADGCEQLSLQGATSQEKTPSTLLIIRKNQSCSPFTIALAAESQGATSILLIVDEDDMDVNKENDILSYRPTDTLPSGMSSLNITVLSVYTDTYDDFISEALESRNVSLNNGSSSINILLTRPTFNFGEDIAQFSSRGPTYDGRIKPDVVAPGSFVLSSSAYPGAKYQCGTHYLEGTSMATPVVAGALSLIRQYFMEGYSPSGQPNASDAFIPTGSLLKAIIVNSARPLSGQVDINGDGDFTCLTSDSYPYRYQGHGMIRLEKAVPFIENPFFLFYNDQNNISTGEQQQHTISITEVPGELAVTLVWIDPPSALAAEDPVVNRLILSVDALDGTPLQLDNFYANMLPANPNTSVVYGNMNYDEKNQSFGSNSRNTVQKVLLNITVPGDYIIHVEGHSIPMGPQSYSLVASYHLYNQTECSFGDLCTGAREASTLPSSSSRIDIDQEAAYGLSALGFMSCALLLVAFML